MDLARRPGIRDGRPRKEVRRHCQVPPRLPWQEHNSSMVANFVAIGGLVGVIASVSLLALQARTLAQQAKIGNAIARATVINNASSNLHQIFQIFIERPELRPYFYESKAPPLRGYKRRVRLF